MPLLPILRKSPFFRLIFLYGFGIAFADCIRNNSLPVVYLLYAVVTLWFILWLVIRVHRNFNTGWIAGVLVAMIIFICGIWAAEIDFNKEKQALSLPEDTVLYRAVIIDMPVAETNFVKATARILEIKTREGWIHQGLKVLLYISVDSVSCMPLPGSELILQSALKNIPPPANPEEFNYHKYLAIRHIYKQSFVSPGQGGEEPVGLTRRSPRIWACMMRNRLLHLFRNMDLEPGYFGLVSALTLGYKEDVDASTRKAFSQAGVMHIMALSGFNVGIIALVLNFILGIFDKSPAGKYAKTLIIILFLWLFALITGLSPSVTRATVMISFLLAGRLFWRQVNTYNILFVSAFLLLTFSPGMLSDVSFQLSFAAVAGILIYQPFMNNLVTFKISVIHKIWQLFTLSCAAQLATLPLTLFYFHQFPVYFWLTNLYVVPLVSVIICIAGACLAVSWIKPVALLVSKVLAVFLKTLLLSVTVVEKLPFSMISGVYINRAQVTLLFLAIFTLALIILFKTVRWFPILLFLIIIFEWIHFVHAKQLADQKTGLISAMKKTTVINLFSGKRAILLVNEGKFPDQNDLAYAFGNFWIKHGVSPLVISLDSLDPPICNGITFPGLYCRSSWRGNNMLITFNEKRMILLRDDRFYRFHARQPLKADFVLINKDLSVHADRIAAEIQSNRVVIDGSVKKSRIKQWKLECKKNGLACYVIPEQGPFRLDDDFDTPH
jgi:competence protein ComEC